ncbi:Uncharacterized protein PBTT_09401 [Plasmodiophora brassicae]
MLPDGGSASGTQHGRRRRRVSSPIRRRSAARGHSLPDRDDGQSATGSKARRARRRRKSAPYKALATIRSREFGMGPHGAYHGAWKTMPAAPARSLCVERCPTPLHMDQTTSCGCDPGPGRPLVDAAAATSLSQSSAALELVFMQFAAGTRCSSPQGDDLDADDAI